MEDFPGATLDRNHLPMQKIWVQSLVWEDFTCHRANKPMHHNYWSPLTLGPVSHNYWGHLPQLWKPACLELVLCSKRSHRNEKSVHRNRECTPLTATRESPCTATKNQHSQKWINLKKKLYWIYLDLWLVIVHCKQSSNSLHHNLPLIHNFFQWLVLSYCQTIPQTFTAMSWC